MRADIDTDICGMDEEDMVDEIMTVRAQRNALVIQLKVVLHNFTDDDFASARMLLEEIEVQRSRHERK